MSDGTVPVSVSNQPEFARYREEFVIRTPDLRRQRFDDELLQLTAQDGMAEMVVSPSTSAVPGVPPTRPREDGVEKYLWVIGSDSVPSIPEEGRAGRDLSRGRVAHTNLTGGQPAFCGGELWYRDDSSFWLSGGSGRYPPRSGAELERVVECFASCGYSVASFGWDVEADGPARFLRGRAKWT